jgi:ABC-type lipoprotein release transport system permease subunit
MRETSLKPYLVPVMVGGLIVSPFLIYGLTAIAGLYPSWLATRVQPVEALRYE